ncbi:GlsB/YeaQ/YmgE family stress response membrane protein [Pseudorhodobacter sp.]|uniref:GlsB/YeaQ/YmgE family stress response membrane protein n=1 Tax=Pseudorhodobacter sp. TaxID=1934400 RepID=UPI002649B1E4|nr:GlsB/YeaQ/YmgE family stress response membrane protein [Pseudorhodobacter sp.]MDN5787242.1 GlsB/YeaQ/YmgE family stress response membrane protein [Pseudorhodobacter sp.]
MPVILAIVIIGSAFGFLASRMMRIEADVPTTIAIGIAGAFIAWVILRLPISVIELMAVLFSIALGAMLLLSLWQNHKSK